MSENRYRTLGPRFVAAIIDTFVLVPFLALIILVPLSDLVSWFVAIAMVTTNIAYFVIFHGRNGQTVGKKIVRVRVVRSSDEAPISYRQSMWRESPLITINLIFFGLEALLFSLDPHQVSALLLSLYGFIQPLPNIWWLSDAATTLTNRKRRSIHDYIGGTVVVNEK